jgi:hypothetical protein
MRTSRREKVYATLPQRFCAAELKRLGFRYEAASGSQMIKRGAARTLLATASSLDGQVWRVTPAVRFWR